MSTVSLSSIKSFDPNDVAFQVFRRAKYITVGDLDAFSADRPAIWDIIDKLANEKFHDRPPPSGYRQKVMTRCINLKLSIQFGASVMATPPSCYICPISLDLMMDPVITPHGVSYERHVIEQWLSEHECDPFTHGAMHKMQLIPNIALKNAIHNYKLFSQRQYVQRTPEMDGLRNDLVWTKWGF